MKRRKRRRMFRIWRKIIYPVLALAFMFIALGIVGRMDLETELAESGQEETETEAIATAAECEVDIEDFTFEIPYGLSLEEVYEIARVTYLETGIQGEGYEYVTYLTACVIINRYLDWGYDSIFEVIEDEDQYATAGWETDEINEVTWEAVYKALTDTDRNVHFQASNYWLEDSGYALYYDDGITQIYE